KESGHRDRSAARALDGCLHTMLASCKAVRFDSSIKHRFSPHSCRRGSYHSGGLKGLSSLGGAWVPTWVPELSRISVGFDRRRTRPRGRPFPACLSSICSARWPESFLRFFRG